MNGLRIEFQDRVNFVILDWDTRAEKAFGFDLNLGYHPNFATIVANSDEVVEYLFLEPRSGELEGMIERLLADHEG